MLFAALLTAATLAADAPASAAAPAPRSQGALTVAILEREAVVAKRRRLWRGSLGLSLGALQSGLGVYGLASPRFDPVMRRSAVAQLLLGASAVGLGIYALAWPRPIEQLRRSEAFAALTADPDDAAAMHELRLLWAARARRAQTMRYVMGGGYIAGGVGLTALGAVTHFYAGSERSEVETLWSYTTLGTGIGLVLTGALWTTIHSQVERTYEAFASVYGWPSYRTTGRAPRGAQLQVAPLVGGVQILGAF
ncbi:MAG: hypothetical protein R3A79_09985 [Nannocystaceae bacterium]